ncbi:tRNA (N6-isopentenyl adenosine(37)-C2)-methylthiotransferase MiaB [Desulfospira joergensenii]|uniref:tRNA (N6-isopentenyl adenosine(37)-C2)-methylthiotransferase MiaB n=1 Tax=Desulfospira joergensenii TaxID=53329 RepID=UPI0003B71500|nr:tRNA (N6-isopentenyl adenosine(37)-C2)-methylthiotransferase MiaB [Desulfospira joergensenii]
MTKYKGLAFINTIGCQMNVYDSEKLAGILNSYGFEKTQDMDEADIVVCNTCSIRHKAEEKAFSFLGRFAREKTRRPHLITVMAGCVAQQEGKKAFDRLPHLNLVLGTQAFSRFGAHIDALKSGTQRIVDIEESDMIFEALPDETCFEENKVSRFVTIMQGCDNFCTYCVVPYVRGRERSRAPEAILEEIRILARNGIKEVTLLGQNVNSYGIREQGLSFPGLLEKVSRIEGIKRIRFATSHPKDLSEELIHAVRDIDKVCRHVHLPVQSGSDKILKKMNRGYTRETYLSRIRALREACPDIGLSTDIIVGFPFETKEDFHLTLDLIQEARFDSIFAFAYSDRSSAPAAKFSSQVEETEKKDRLNQLLELQETLTEKKNRAEIGQTLGVLVEGFSAKERDGFVKPSAKTRQMTGRTESNKIVHFASDGIKIGDLVDIKIEKTYPHSLWGTSAADQCWERKIK